MGDESMHGKFVWNELATNDIDKAKSFYGETLGWEFEEFRLPDGKYWVARSNGELVGGIGDMDTAADTGANSPAWFAFIEVDDVNARVTKAIELGATIIQPATDVLNVGRVAVLRDPTGAVIGWMTSLKS
jgi:uncharacterized protein